MLSLKGSDFSFMLQRQSDVVKAVQQAMLDECIDGEVCTESLIVPHLTLLQINCQFVVVDLLRPPHDGSDLGIR